MRPSRGLHRSTLPDHPISRRNRARSTLPRFCRVTQLTPKRWVMVAFDVRRKTRQSRCRLRRGMNAKLDGRTRLDPREAANSRESWTPR
jgi:hypothetical protein